MGLLAILIAAAVGYAVTVGLRGHMEKEPDLGPKLSPAQARAAQCMAAFDKLPTSSDPDKDLRKAAKTAFLYATPGTEDMVETLANHCTDLGYPEAGACLREKANSMRMAGPAGTVPAIVAPSADYAPLAKPIFPTGIAPDTGLGGGG